MKKMMMLFVGLALIASCGGGSDTPAATPTTSETKAVAGSTVGPTADAASAAIATAMAVSASISPLSTKVGDRALSPKTAISNTVNETINCTDIGGDGGTVVATGTIACDYTASATGWTCSGINGTVALAFTDCGPFDVTIGGDAYSETLNGTDSTATLEGGTASGSSSGITALTFNGSLSGTPNVTGTVDGNADISHITFSGEGASPTITCSGTATVTYGTTEETCTISSDCSTCEQ